MFSMDRCLDNYIHATKTKLAQLRAELHIDVGALFTQIARADSELSHQEIAQLTRYPGNYPVEGETGTSSKWQNKKTI